MLIKKIAEPENWATLHQAINKVKPFSFSVAPLEGRRYLISGQAPAEKSQAT